MAVLASHFKIIILNPEKPDKSQNSINPGVWGGGAETQVGGGGGGGEREIPAPLYENLLVDFHASMRACHAKK